jgi:hypothetical protein
LKKTHRWVHEVFVHNSTSDWPFQNHCVSMDKARMMHHDDLIDFRIHHG